MNGSNWGPRGECSLTKTFTFTSGKGGVGKTTLAANVALQLGRQGYKVLLLDGDLGMSNLDVMFGVRPTSTIFEVMEGKVGLSDILIETAPGVFLIPGGSGIRQLQSLTTVQRHILVSEISQLPISFDYMLIDTGPGIDENVLYLNSAAQDINVVVTPDPSSLADAYALIKVLSRDFKQNKFSIVTNQVKDEEEGLKIFRAISDVAAQFLFVGLDYRGAIPSDPYLRRATKSQQLILRANGNSPSAQAIREFTDKLCSFNMMDHAQGGIQFFWEQYFGVA
jgi:flagellar biosynthesis protein FlhG